MKYISLVLLFVFPFLLLLSQDEIEPDEYLFPTAFTEKTYPNHQIGINVSPEVSYRILTDKTSNSLGIMDYRSQKESSIIGLTAGVSYAYTFNRFWGVETGLFYALKGFQEMEDGLFTYDEYDPNIDLFVNTKTVRFIYQFHYVDIPVKANFTLGKGRVKFISSLGIVGNLLVTPHDVTRINYEDGSKQISRSVPDFKPNHNRFSISALASVGMDFMFTDQIKIKIEPVGRVGVTPAANASYGISERLYNIGLNVGLYWTL